MENLSVWRNNLLGFQKWPIFFGITRVFSHQYLLYAVSVVCKNNTFMKILQKCNESDIIKSLDWVEISS